MILRPADLVGAGVDQSAAVGDDLLCRVLEESPDQIMLGRLCHGDQQLFDAYDLRGQGEGAQERANQQLV